MELVRIAVMALLLALVAGIPSTAYADDGAVWTGVFATGKLHDGDSGPRLWLDLHARRTGTGMPTIVRPGIGWDFSKGVNATVGYALVSTLASGTGEVTGDHRIWQQLLLSHKLENGLALSFRPRLEQRFHFTSRGTQLRLRLQGRVGVPLSEVWGLSVWDELFLGLNDVPWATQGFDQNRAFVGPYIQAEGARFEVGYLNVPLRKEGVTTMSHVAAMNLFLSF